MYDVYCKIHNTKNNNKNSEFYKENNLRVDKKKSVQIKVHR